MENEFLDKVEDNAAVQIWSERMQLEKGDSLMEGYVSELWDFTRISVTQNNIQEMKEIREKWDDEIKQLFYCNYGDLPYYSISKWTSTYSELSPNFGTLPIVDLVPTVEEYTTLLRCPKIQTDKAYSRATNVLTFLKKLMNIKGMSEQWVIARFKQKGDSKFIPWRNLRDLILAHPDVKKRVNVFTSSIYRLVIFPKALGHIDEVVSDLFDQLDKKGHPFPQFWPKLSDP
ncbi:6-phosphofructo-2-kinase/fructose-2,6-bisphosphatase-like protein [Gossypium australe]|uniref:6-phosphofructo-2-kinase/fructose-2, 6-bisphosphatase-like protein n=1 Tax=Gossypium australe TaxID=47621 RepID=A0A5B6X6Q3_9ROSI|nr:6-phosphofructo-2-kinase/fructose-2,6-bisphosphatase-like protein [Gossypium australe]